LVVEGGGMRGVYTAAMLLALHALDASEIFDDVFATSAGALNAAYFLSGKGEDSADGYYRVLADGRFINLRRPWLVVDVEFVIRDMLVSLRPLAVTRVLGSRSRFGVAVADFDTATARLIDVHEGGPPLSSVLKAAIALPVYYNRLVRIDGFQAFDAGLCNPLPIGDALRAGCSHVLVLTSCPARHVDVPVPRWQRILFNLRFAHGDRAINAMFTNSWRVANASRNLANGDAPSQANIATLSPTSARVTSITRDQQLLRATLIGCAKSTLAALGAESRAREKLDEWIRTNRI
jgi:predicted patatin/cPLA2 family phospholipase